jgi:ABC-2 type transport system ATP-binding protein
VLRRLVQRLAAAGRMVVYSSHVLEIVEQVATDVLILHDGQVVAHDSVSRLRELMKLSSLEEVFKNLVIATDLDRRGRGPRRRDAGLTCTRRGSSRARSSHGCSRAT